MMFKRLLLALSLLGLTAAPALASNCAAYPYTLTNGSTADANQVMSNFNSILNCGNNNLAKNGANSDITSLTGLTTPLSLAQGGTANTTGQPSGTAGGDITGTYPSPTLVTTVRTQHVSVITSNGTFTIPSGASSDTVFDIICIGGGGGSGGTAGSSATDGGGSGGAREAFFSGFTASTNITLAIGSAGAAGVGATPTSGGAGGTTTVTYNGVAIMTSGGGFGSDLNGGTVTTTSGNAGTSSATAGASGLTLIAQTSLGASAGAQSRGGGVGFQGGAGGSNAIGQGGNGGGEIGGPSHTNPTAGVAGGGGGGAWQGASTGSNVNGAAGGAGVVIIKYVL